MLEDQDEYADSNFDGNENEIHGTQNEGNDL